jgi:DNA-binding transcriptional ArsR family regulator
MGRGRWLCHHDASLALNARLDRKLAALADPARRATVELLRERPRRAGELAAALGLSPPAMSKHLRALREGGLVEETHQEFDARVRVYALKSGAMRELRQWLDDTERLWSRQLVAFKDHLGKK